MSKKNNAQAILNQVIATAWQMTEQRHRATDGPGHLVSLTIERDANGDVDVRTKYAKAAVRNEKLTRETK